MIEVQQAIYTKLTGAAPLMALVNNVYDISVQGTDYPYVLIGDDMYMEWDTDDRTGMEVTVTLHVWSAQRGKKETKTIQKAMYDALHLQQLSVSGYQFIVCYYVSDTTVVDPDGLATHGISKYRINIAK